MFKGLMHQSGLKLSQVLGKKMNKAMEKTDQNIIDDCYANYGQFGKKIAGNFVKKKDENILNKLVIPVDCYWKKVFNNVIMLVSVINVFSQGFYSAFGNPK